MVERELEPPEILSREPPRVARVVSCSDGPADRGRSVENADGVAARIALRIGINTEHGSDPRPDSGFLFDLARTGGFRRLAQLAEAPGKRPASLEGGPSTANEEQSSAAVADPGVDG